MLSSLDPALASWPKVTGCIVEGTQHDLHFVGREVKQARPTVRAKGPTGKLSGFSGRGKCSPRPVRVGEECPTCRLPALGAVTRPDDVRRALNHEPDLPAAAATMSDANALGVVL